MVSPQVVGVLRMHCKESQSKMCHVYMVFAKPHNLSYNDPIFLPIVNTMHACLDAIRCFSGVNHEMDCRTAWLGVHPRYTRSLYQGTLPREGFVFQGNFFFPPYRLWPMMLLVTAFLPWPPLGAFYWVTLYFEGKRGRNAWRREV